MGAALTKPGCVSTARWRGPGERDREEYARNQCRKVPQRFTGSNLVDVGRERCIPWHFGAMGTSLAGETRVRGGHGESLRRSHGEAAGTELGSSSIERAAVNTGTARCRFPSRSEPARWVG